jgi:hypothetical protein
MAAPTPAAAAEPAPELLRQKHARFASLFLTGIPGDYAHLEANRMTILFFALATLDLIDCLDSA